MTIQLLDKELEAYAAEMSSPASALLDRLEDYTQEYVPLPIMLAGYAQGRALSMFAQMIEPQYVLEIGTYTGYSAICLSEGLTEDGILVTIDKNPSLEAKTKEYLDQSPKGNQIKYITGDAKEVIPTLDYPWDLVFLDADKKGYAGYFDQVIDRIRPGGYIIADNVLYNGEVTLSEDQMSANAKAIKEFNHKVNQDPRVSQVLLPIRDGLTIIRKTH